MAVAFAVPDYGGWAWDTEFNEISRPCLRKLDLEVEIQVHDEADEWFDRGTCEHALQTIALDANDLYDRERAPRYQPVLIAAASALAVAVSLLAR